MGANARGKAEWDRTANLMVILAEPNRDRTARPSPFKPKDFHPYYLPKKPKKPISPKEGMANFRAAMRARQANG